MDTTIAEMHGIVDQWDSNGTWIIERLLKRILTDLHTLINKLDDIIRVTTLRYTDPVNWSNGIR